MATALAPSDHEAHYNLGITLREEGDVDAALHEFETALALKPDYEDARYSRAMILHAKGQNDVAQNDFNEIAALSEFRAGLDQAKGLIKSASERLKRNNPDAALQDATSALNFWPNDPIAY